MDLKGGPHLPDLQISGRFSPARRRHAFRVFAQRYDLSVSFFRRYRDSSFRLNNEDAWLGFDCSYKFFLTLFIAGFGLEALNHADTSIAS